MVGRGPDASLDQENDEIYYQKDSKNIHASKGINKISKISSAFCI